MNDPQETAVAVREHHAVAHTLTVDEVKRRLEFVKQVMANAMEEGVDYGTIPGCGDAKTLLQPGAQKLALTFQIYPQVSKEVLREYPNYHREYEFTIRVGGPTGADGVGTCSTLESKHRYRQGQRVCPSCGKPTIIKGKAEYGGGWICFEKKGGCGQKWPDTATEIADQQVGQIENPNPSDCWNAARKVAFKRAMCHAMITYTNSSMLWTSDLEDMVENDASNPVNANKPKAAPKTSSVQQPRTTTRPSKSKVVDAEEVAKANDESNPELMPQGESTPTEGAAAEHAQSEELAEGQFAIQGQIAFVTQKAGKKKDGTPFTRFGVKARIGEEELWYNTFRSDLGKLAEKLKGKPVTIVYTEEDYNGDTIRNLVGLRL